MTKSITATNARTTHQPMERIVGFAMHAKIPIWNSIVPCARPSATWGTAHVRGNRPWPSANNLRTDSPVHHPSVESIVAKLNSIHKAKWTCTSRIATFPKTETFGLWKTSSAGLWYGLGLYGHVPTPSSIACRHLRTIDRRLFVLSMPGTFSSD